MVLLLLLLLLLLQVVFRVYIDDEQTTKERWMKNTAKEK